MTLAVQKCFKNFFLQKKNHKSACRHSPECTENPLQGHADNIVCLNPAGSQSLELNLEKRIVLLTTTDLPRKAGMRWLLTPCFMTCYVVNSDEKQAWIFRDKWIETVSLYTFWGVLWGVLPAGCLAYLLSWASLSLFLRAVSHLLHMESRHPFVKFLNTYGLSTYKNVYERKFRVD